MLICKIIITTKTPTNSNLSSNGGDYYEGFTIKGYKKNRRSKPQFTFNNWSSCEMLEGTFPINNISHKAVRDLLKKYFGDFKTIIRSPKYYECEIIDEA